MLETGVQSRILLVEAIVAPSASGLANQLATWFSGTNVIVHDLQIFKDDNRWVAIVVFRRGPGG